MFLLPLTCHLPASYLPLADGIIALFYRGLLELSKSFLDPFGNRRVSDSGLSADIGIATLIGETNAGSLVWPQGAEVMPFDFPSASLPDLSDAVRYEKSESKPDVPEQ